MYEQQDKNASPVDNPADTLLRSLDENNVMETSKTIGKKNNHEEEVDEEVYEDEYEVETDPKTEHETLKLPKITDSTNAKYERAPSELTAQTEDMSRDEDYVEDPSTSQYDTYNYYNDDYSSPNRSRYRAAGKIIWKLLKFWSSNLKVINTYNSQILITIKSLKTIQISQHFCVLSLRSLLLTISLTNILW